MQNRSLKRAAIVAMRALAGNGGLVFDPKHARHLRALHSRFVTIKPAPAGTTPRQPYFAASLTPAGEAISRHHEARP